MVDLDEVLIISSLIISKLLDHVAFFKGFHNILDHEVCAELAPLFSFYTVKFKVFPKLAASMDLWG
jgi:hypothetical protein